MFALEVEYLMGRVISSRHDDRRTVEWPPHPSRLFSALVAAYKECDLGNDVRDALKWLERLPEPCLTVPVPYEDGFRDVHDLFVPVNDSVDQCKVDSKTKKVRLYTPISDGITFRRDRQQRWFPAYATDNPLVYFVWLTANSEGHHHALNKLADNVTYMGHSMSPVRVAIANNPPPPTLVPDPHGNILLRVPGEGRLVHLEHTYQLRLENSAIQPRLGRVARYAEVGKSSTKPWPSSIFREQWVFRKKEGKNILIEDTAILTQGIRTALMSLAPDPLPETLSGHDADGRPTRQPHLAIVPLASVGHRHADGHIMGFAALLPETLTPADREVIEDTLYQLLEIKLGRLGVWQVEQVQYPPVVPLSLRFNEVYTKPCDTWASVTPVAFGHYPGWSDGKRLKVLGGMCSEIGLPRPVEVRLGPISPFRGTPKATDIVRPKQALGRVMAHVHIRFTEPVHGPVILGAGRFLGLGLLRPLWPRKEKQS